jgi:UPF0716 protein FxsA
VFWLVALFLGVPLIEVYLFIEVGARIGIFATLGLCVLTAFIGAFLVRVQGLGLLSRLQSELNRGMVPAGAMAEGAMVAVAGVLLITPGFFTDACGFLLLIPFIRQALLANLMKRFRFVRSGGDADGVVIEGEAYEVRPDDDRPPNDNSPWRH